MKIAITTEVREMDAMHQAVKEVCQEYNIESPDKIFFKNRIDTGAIQLQQDMGEYEIDIDSEFIVFIISGISKVIKTIRPTLLFLKGMVSGMEKFFHKPIITDFESVEETPTEFDV